VFGLDHASHTAVHISHEGKLLIIMSMNLFAIWIYDYCVVNGVRQHLAATKRAARPTSDVSKGDKETPEQATTRHSMLAPEGGEGGE
jgi:hypothetical protein